MDIRDIRDGNFDPSDIPVERLLAVLPAMLLLGILAYLTFASFFTVDAHEQAVVLRFGKYHATTTPGLHFCVPLVDTVLKVSMEEHSLNLPSGASGGRSSVGSASEEESLVLTGDLNAASVEWTENWS